jgi:hypothetical protein
MSTHALVAVEKRNVFWLILARAPLISPFIFGLMISSTGARGHVVMCFFLSGINSRKPVSKFHSRNVIFTSNNQKYSYD